MHPRSRVTTALEPMYHWKRGCRNLHSHPPSKTVSASLCLLSYLPAWISPLPQAWKSDSLRDPFPLVHIHVLFPSHGTTFVHRFPKTIHAITIVSPISGPTGTFLENAPVVHLPPHPPTDLIWTATSETEMAATDATVMWLASTPLQRARVTRSVAVRPHVGIRHPHPCSIATVSGKGEGPTTRLVRRHRSVVMVYTIPMGREGLASIENAMLMTNGGGIGTHLATMTNVDPHRHHPRRGDHTIDRRSWIGTESDSTVREKETEIYASVTGIESGIGIWVH